MAGSFGFEAEKHHWSMKIAERALLPKLRSAPEDTLIIADGFSCREQIEQGSGRETRHLAEAIAEGIGFRKREIAGSGGRELVAAGVVAAAGVAVLAGVLLTRRRRPEPALAQDSGRRQ
jgi:hypothetical protein